MCLDPPVYYSSHVSNVTSTFYFYTGGDPLSSSNALRELGKPDATGWELALVTTPSNQTSKPPESKMVGIIYPFSDHNCLLLSWSFG